MTFFVIISIVNLDFSGPIDKIVFKNIYPLLILSWFIYCVMRILVILSACFDHDAIPKFFIMFEELRRKHRDSKHMKWIRKQTVIVTFIVWCLIIFNIIAGACGLLYTNLFHKLVTPWSKTEDNAIFIAMGFCVFFIFTASWLLPIGFQHLLCKLLRAEYKLLTNDMINDDLKKDHCIERHRLRHQQITRLVYIADDFLGKFNLLSFGFNVLGPILNLYNIIRSDMDIVTLTVCLFWLFLNLSNLVMDCFTAGVVSSAVSTQFYNLTLHL